MSKKWGTAIEDSKPADDGSGQHLVKVKVDGPNSTVFQVYRQSRGPSDSRPPCDGCKQAQIPGSPRHGWTVTVPDLGALLDLHDRYGRPLCLLILPAVERVTGTAYALEIMDG